MCDTIQLLSSGSNQFLINKKQNNTFDKLLLNDYGVPKISFLVNDLKNYKNVALRWCKGCNCIIKFWDVALKKIYVE